MRAGDVVDAELVDLLMCEYTAASDRLARLDAARASTLRERDAVVEALSATGLTQKRIVELTGLTITRLRDARWRQYNRGRQAQEGQVDE